MSVYSSRGRIKSLTVLSGSGLASKDIGGSSDPYVLVKTYERQYSLKPALHEAVTRHKTATIKKNLDPTWNETVTPFELPRSYLSPSGGIKDVLRFEVWDWDKVGGDDSMGIADIVLQDDQRLRGDDETAEPVELELPLVPLEGKSNEKVSGSIKIKLAWFNSEQDYVRGLPPAAEKAHAEKEAAAKAAADGQAAAKARLEAIANLLKTLMRKEDDPVSIKGLASLVDKYQKGFHTMEEYQSAKSLVIAKVPTMYKEGRVPEETFAITLRLMHAWVTNPAIIPNHNRYQASTLQENAEAREAIMLMLQLSFDDDRAKFWMDEVISRWASDADRNYWFPSVTPLEYPGGQIDKWIEALDEDIQALQLPAKPMAGYGVAVVLHTLLACTMWNMHNSNEGYHHVMGKAMFALLSRLMDAPLGKHPQTRFVMREHQQEVERMFSKGYILGRLLASDDQKRALLDAFKPARPGYMAGVWSR